MNHLVKKCSIAMLLALMVISFACCSKKARCNDCPKWGKVETAKSTHINS